MAASRIGFWSVIIFLFFVNTAYGGIGFIIKADNSDTEFDSATRVDVVTIDSTDESGTNATIDGDAIIIFAGSGAPVTVNTQHPVIHMEINGGEIYGDNVRLAHSQASNSREYPFSGWIFSDEGLTTDTYKIGRASSNEGDTQEISDARIVFIDLDSFTQGEDYFIADAETGTDNGSPSADVWTDIGSAITVPSGNSGEVFWVLGRFFVDFKGAPREARIRVEDDNGDAGIQGCGGSDQLIRSFSSSTNTGMTCFTIYTVPDANEHTLRVQFIVNNTGVDIENANLFIVKTSAFTDDFGSDVTDTEQTTTSNDTQTSTTLALTHNYLDTTDYLNFWSSWCRNQTTNSAGVNCAPRLDGSTQNFYDWDGADTLEFSRENMVYFQVETVASTGNRDLVIRWKHTNSDNTVASIDAGGIFTFEEEQVSAARRIMYISKNEESL